MELVKKPVILFVDDEPEVLFGLERSLRREHGRWDMVFVASGAAALIEIDRRPIDVLVTDMQMPGIDGAAVLRYSQAKRPRARRLVLTGGADEHTTSEAIPIAHEWLTKPCLRATLVKAIDRACGSNEPLFDPLLSRIVGDGARLPGVPAIYATLCATLSNPSVSLDAIARIVERDSATCARFLDVVNATFFALPRALTDVREAITYVGFDTVAQVVLGSEALEVLRCDEPLPGLGHAQVRLHSLLTAQVAAKLLDDLGQPSYLSRHGVRDRIDRWLATTHAIVGTHLAAARGSAADAL